MLMYVVKKYKSIYVQNAGDSRSNSHYLRFFILIIELLKQNYNNCLFKYFKNSSSLKFIHIDQVFKTIN